MKKLLSLVLVILLALGAVFALSACSFECEHHYVLNTEYIQFPTCSQKGKYLETSVCIKCNEPNPDFEPIEREEGYDENFHLNRKEWFRPSEELPGYLDLVYGCTDCGKPDYIDYQYCIDPDYTCPPHLSYDGDNYCDWCYQDIGQASCPGHYDDDGDDFCDNCGFYITPKTKPTSAWFENGSCRLEKGETFRFNLEYWPEDVEDHEFEWTTSDSGIITVDENGLVTAVGDGIAEVIATLKSDASVVARGTVYSGKFTVTFVFEETYYNEQYPEFNDMYQGYKLTGISSEYVPESITIPSEYNGKPVVIIDNQSISRKDGLVELIIPDSVKLIDAYAINNCPDLVTVSIPDSVELMYSDSISSCPKLEYAEDSMGKYLGNSENPYVALVEAADGITEFVANPGTKVIGNQLFTGRSEITSIDLGSVKSIGWETFKGTSITEIVIPDSCILVGTEAFNSSYNLKSITIGKNVRSFGAYAFFACGSVDYLYYNAENAEDLLGGNTTFGFGSESTDTREKIDLVLGPDVKRIPNRAFSYLCGNLPLNVNMSAATELYGMGLEAFAGNGGLTEITIPEKLTEIGADAFMYCGNINVINYDALNLSGDLFKEALPESWYYYNGTLTINISSRVTKIPDNFLKGVFQNCSDGFDVYVKVLALDKLDIGVSAFEGVPMKEFNFSASPSSSIGAYAFKDCTRLTGIYLPETLVSVGDGAFMNTAVTEVNFPAATSYLGKDLFKGCTQLEEVSFHCVAGLTTIPAGAFEGCTALKILEVYSGSHDLLSIGDRAFAYSGITEFYIPDTVTGFGSNIFYGCNDLTAVYLPESMTAIPDSFFLDCKSLKEVDLSNVTTIGASAFKNTGFVTLTIPATVTKVGNYAFADCTALKTFNYAANIQSDNWGTKVFWRSGDATEGFAVNIANTVTSIPNNFLATGDNTVRATAISFESGSQLTHIGGGAFSGLTLVKELTVPATVVYIGNNAFGSMWSLSDLTITMKDSMSIGSGLFYNVGKDSADGLTLHLRNNSNMISNTLSEANLTEIIFEDGNQSFSEIKEFTFTPFTKLERVQLHLGLTTLNMGAFFGCQVTEINLPLTVTTVNGISRGAASMGTDPKITNINVDENNQSFTFSEGILYDKNMYTLIWCPSTLTTDKLVIPDSVSTIAPNAFAYVRHVQEIVLPYGVKKIAENTFFAANYLTYINLDNITELGEYCFAYTNLDYVVTPKGLTEIADYAFYHCNARNVHITSNVKKIGSYAFYYSSTFFLTLDEGIEEIGAYAFYQNEVIGGTEDNSPVIIPKSVTKMGANVFGYDPKVFPPEFSNGIYVWSYPHIKYYNDYSTIWYDTYCIVEKISG